MQQQLAHAANVASGPAYGLVASRAWPFDEILPRPEQKSSRFSGRGEGNQ